LPVQDNTKNIETQNKNKEPVVEKKKEEEKKQTDSKPKAQPIKEQSIGPSPVIISKKNYYHVNFEVEEKADQGEWISTKKLKNKKGQSQKTGSSNQLTSQEKPEPVIEQTEAQKPEVEQSAIKNEPIVEKEPVSEIKVQQSQIEQPPVQQKPQVQVQSNEPEKKGKPQQKKKIIESWNADNQKSDTSASDTKVEGSPLDFPTLGEVIKQPAKQTKEIEDSKSEDKTKKIPAPQKKIEDDKDFPSLEKAISKPTNLQEKPSKNPLPSQSKSSDKQQSGTNKALGIKGDTWASQSVKDNKKQEGANSKYVDDFPSL
jgi:hypothetical protein